MRGGWRIDYDIEKYQFTEAGETPRLREQVARSIPSVVSCGPGLSRAPAHCVTERRLCHQLRGCLFRLLLVRAPQLIADVRESVAAAVKPPFSTANVTAASSRFETGFTGCTGSLSLPPGKPHSSRRCNRADGGPVPADCPGDKAGPSGSRQALNAGLPVTASTPCSGSAVSEWRRTSRSCAGPAWRSHSRGGGQRQFRSIPPGRVPVTALASE